MSRFIPANAAGSEAVVRQLWLECGLPVDILSQLSMTGERPLLPTSFHVAVAAQSSIACAALGAAAIGQLRGQPSQQISVDMHDAEYETTGYFDIDGKAPATWAPLSGLYQCGDGHVRIHANFDHHRDGALRLLGITDPVEKVTKDTVSDALKSWRATDFESAAAEQGLVVSASRSFHEWDQTAQPDFIRRLPLITVEKVEDGSPGVLPQISTKQRPLSGLKVLELTRILAGPVCGRTLAAYGADVMLVNSPRLPNIEHIADTSRGKRSCLLDLNLKDESERLRNLVSESNVFVQGYRPGGLQALGFGVDELADIRPGIVYVSLSAYGHEGPWQERRGFDSLVQTATGFNHAEAEAFSVETPRAMPVQILDYASGFLMAFGAQVALHRQLTEGGSWHVRVSLAQTALWLREMGRVEGNLESAVLTTPERCETYQSGFGRLRALPHSASFSSTPAHWQQASVPPGHHPASWM